ncbi:MAG: class I SAM-dependent methyltransferase [Chloroflexota bacterium]|jgi:ubiquinone/menaquinone biosynthesis C-methylase UbiE
MPMPASRNFDQVAHIYDETRRLPEPVLANGIPAILDVAGPEARILEAGTGTGRMAVPLLERGANLTGVDLSLNMMARQRAKSDRAQLACASITALPFGDGRFDAILTAHVLHLIPDWQAALAEFKRVLRSGGVYIDARSESEEESHSRRAVRYWRDWLLARGGLPQGVDIGPRDWAEIDPALRAIGATVSTLEPVTYTTRYTMRDRVRRTRERSYSSSWDVPDELLAASADALEAWVIAEYGGLDVELTDEEVFRLHIARFD